MFSMLSTCPFHLIFTLITGYLMKSANYEVPYYVFVYPPVTSSFLVPNILLSKRNLQNKASVAMQSFLPRPEVRQYSYMPH
jgi:hypothetical protein